MKLTLESLSAVKSSNKEKEALGKEIAQYEEQIKDLTKQIHAIQEKRDKAFTQLEKYESTDSKDLDKFLGSIQDYFSPEGEKPTKSKMDQVIKRLESTPVSVIAKVVDSDSKNSRILYPTFWARSGYPYPKVLAKAIASLDGEYPILEDWLKPFHDPELKFSPEVEKIFFNGILKSVNLLPRLQVLSKDRYFLKALKEAAKKKPDDVRMIFDKLNDYAFNDLKRISAFSKIIRDLGIKR